MIFCMLRTKHLLLNTDSYDTNKNVDDREIKSKQHNKA